MLLINIGYDFVGYDAISILSDRTRQVSIQTRFAVDEDEWPPNQPKTFIPLLLLHHHNHSLDNTINGLKDLPEPCANIVRQLAKLSLEAFNKNKLVFTFKDIEKACPDIANTTCAINGFGLLQAVQHNGLTGTILTPFTFLYKNFWLLTMSVYFHHVNS